MRYNLILSVLVFVMFSSIPTSAQQQPDPTFRHVYWLHDINEDDISSTPNNYDSQFWKNYIGDSRVITGGCPTPKIGFFKHQGASSYKMTPLSLPFYSDRPSPMGLYSVRDNGNNELLRNVQGNSESANAVGDKLHSRMREVNYGQQPKPFIIAQGSGAALAMDIDRRFPNTEFGGIISIGGAHRGVELINSASNGTMDRIDKRMRKDFDSGFDKFVDKTAAKIYSTLFSLGLTFVGQSIADLVGEALKKLGDKLAAKILEKLIGLGISAEVSEDIPALGLNRWINYSGSVETAELLSAPKNFNQYVKFAYTSTNRPLLQDLKPNTTFINNAFQSHTAPSNIPIVSINGRLEKTSYFQVMQTAQWVNHTKNQCLDIAPETNLTNPTALELHDKLGESKQQIYVETFKKLADDHKTGYIVLSSVLEGVKIAVATAAGGGIPGLIVGGVFGIVGMVQAVESANEIHDAFSKGEKWCKYSADDEWRVAIGAYKDTTIMVTRPTYPNGRFTTDENGNGVALDPVLVTAPVTYPMPLPNDGIVGTRSQESPQEQDWRKGVTKSGLNLDANKVDHFSQANHPVIRERIQATIEGRTSQSNPKIRTAFFVEKE